jgi:hypothetical protein
VLPICNLMRLDKGSSNPRARQQIRQNGLGSTL